MYSGYMDATTMCGLYGYQEAEEIWGKKKRRQMFWKNIHKKVKSELKNLKMSLSQEGFHMDAVKYVMAQARFVVIKASSAIY